MDLIEFQRWEDKIEKNPERRDEYKRVKNQWATEAFEYIIHEFDIDPKDVDFKHMTIDIFMKYYKQTKGRIRNDTKNKIKTLGSSSCIYEEDFEKHKKILKWDISYLIDNPNISYEFIKKSYICVDKCDLSSLEYNKHLTFENIIEIYQILSERPEYISNPKYLMKRILDIYRCNKNFTIDIFMKYIDISDSILHVSLREYIVNPNIIFIPKTSKFYYEYQQDIERKIIKTEIVEDKETFLSKWEKHKDWKYGIMCNPSFSFEFLLSDQYFSRIKMSKNEYFNDSYCDAFGLGGMLEFNIGITLQECKILKNEYIRSENGDKFTLKEYIERNDMTRDRMNYFRKHAPHFFE